MKEIEKLQKKLRNPSLTQGEREYLNAQLNTLILEEIMSC